MRFEPPLARLSSAREAEGKAYRPPKIKSAAAQTTLPRLEFVIRHLSFVI